MKLDVLFFNALRWLRLRMANQQTLPARPRPSAARSASDATGSASPLPVAHTYNPESLTAEARAKLSRLRAEADTRHRATPAPRVKAFDASVFDGFKTPVRSHTETSPDEEVRTVFVPRDDAYAPTIYIPRKSAPDNEARTR